MRNSRRWAQFWIFTPNFFKFREFGILHSSERHVVLKVLTDNKVCYFWNRALCAATAHKESLFILFSNTNCSCPAWKQLRNFKLLFIYLFFYLFLSFFSYLNISILYIYYLFKKSHVFIVLHLKWASPSNQKKGTHLEICNVSRDAHSDSL